MVTTKKRQVNAKMRKIIAIIILYIVLPQSTQDPSRTSISIKIIIIIVSRC